MALTLWKNKLILKHLIGMKCNNDKNKNLYFRIFGIFHIFNQIFFWFYTKNLACRVLKFLRQKCIVLKFLNPKFQLLNLRKWWFYKGLKPWHYLWDTLYVQKRGLGNHNKKSSFFFDLRKRIEKFLSFVHFFVWENTIWISLL